VLRERALLVEHHLLRGGNTRLRADLALLLRLHGSQVLLLSLLNLCPGFRPGRRNPCLALLLRFDSSEPLLLSFCGLPSCFGVGGCLCLTLLLFFEPLLLSFSSLAFCFGTQDGCGGEIALSSGCGHGPNPSRWPDGPNV
jgi:hypothetical protein